MDINSLADHCADCIIRLQIITFAQAGWRRGRSACPNCALDQKTLRRRAGSPTDGAQMTKHRGGCPLLTRIAPLGAGKDRLSSPAMGGRQSQ